MIFPALPLWIRLRPVTAVCMAATVLLVAGNYFLWHSREEILQRHLNIRQKAEFVVGALQGRSRIDGDLNTLQDALARIEENLLDEGSMEVNLGYFYNLEKATRVHLLRLNQLAATTAVDGNPFKAVPFSMQVSGSYRQSMAFLRGLETGPRILRVRNSSFERGAETGEFLLDITVEVIAKSKV